MKKTMIVLLVLLLLHSTSVFSDTITAGSCPAFTDFHEKPGNFYGWSWELDPEIQSQWQINWRKSSPWFNIFSPNFSDGTPLKINIHDDIKRTVRCIYQLYPNEAFIIEPKYNHLDIDTAHLSSHFTHSEHSSGDAFRPPHLIYDFSCTTTAGQPENCQWAWIPKKS